MIDVKTYHKALEHLIKAPDKLDVEVNDFCTLESAIAEIKRLKEEQKTRYYGFLLVLLYHRYSRPSRGRPHKLPFEINKSQTGIKITLTKKTKNKQGRPASNNATEKKELIKLINIIKGEENISDKTLVPRMVAAVYKDKSTHFQRSATVKYLRQIKYFRDSQSIPQKPKNPQ